MLKMMHIQQNFTKCGYYRFSLDLNSHEPDRCWKWCIFNEHW